jgi:hypothetical protein
MNGIPMTGCFRARMPVGTQGTLRRHPICPTNASPLLALGLTRDAP